MKKIVYCVFDTLAQEVGNLLVYPNDEVAKREVISIMKSVDAGIRKDLLLFRLGEVKCTLEDSLAYMPSIDTDVCLVLDLGDIDYDDVQKA